MATDYFFNNYLRNNRKVSGRINLLELSLPAAMCNVLDFFDKNIFIQTRTIINIIKNIFYLSTTSNIQRMIDFLFKLYCFNIKAQRCILNLN